MPFHFLFHVPPLLRLARGQLLGREGAFRERLNMTVSSPMEVELGYNMY